MNNQKHWHKVGRPTWDYLYRIYKDDSFTAAMNGELEKYESSRKKTFSVPKSLEKQAAENHEKKTRKETLTKAEHLLNAGEKKEVEKTNGQEKGVKAIESFTSHDRSESIQKYTVGQLIDKMIESGVKSAVVDIENLKLNFNIDEL